MKTIVNNIAVFQEGDIENQSIIFIHGFPFDHNMWIKQVKELIINYHCVTYDIRGLGESAAGAGQFTMELFVDDLENIINELNLEKPVICGLSMGGYISLRAVERFQDKLGGLILCDTKADADDNEGKIKRAEGIRKIENEGLQKFASSLFPNLFTEHSQKNLKEYSEILERTIEYDPVGVKGSLLAMPGRTDTNHVLEQIKLPVLVLCGEEDKLTPPDKMKELADKIDDAEFVIVPNAAHMSPVENSEFFNYKLKEFLERIK